MNLASIILLVIVTIIAVVAVAYIYILAPSRKKEIEKEENPYKLVDVYLRLSVSSIQILFHSNKRTDERFTLLRGETEEQYFMEITQQEFKDNFSSSPDLFNCSPDLNDVTFGYYKKHDNKITITKEHPFDERNVPDDCVEIYLDYIDRTITNKEVLVSKETVKRIKWTFGNLLPRVFYELPTKENMKKYNIGQ